MIFAWASPFNFSKKLSNVFFIRSPSLTFPKIGEFFFSSMIFFYRPPSLDFFWSKTEK